jgi:hypothetical protein
MCPRGEHLNKNTTSWTEDEDDLLWEHYRPGMPSQLLADLLARHGYKRTPMACRLRASRLRHANTAQLRIRQPSEIEILALHRPWRPT